MCIPLVMLYICKKDDLHRFSSRVQIILMCIYLVVMMEIIRDSRYRTTHIVEVHPAAAVDSVAPDRAAE